MNKKTYLTMLFCLAVTLLSFSRANALDLQPSGNFFANNNISINVNYVEPTPCAGKTGQEYCSCVNGTWWLGCTGNGPGVCVHDFASDPCGISGLSSMNVANAIAAIEVGKNVGAVVAGTGSICAVNSGRVTWRGCNGDEIPVCLAINETRSCPSGSKYSVVTRQEQGGAYSIQ